MRESLGAVIIVSCARDLRVNQISIPAVIENIPSPVYTIVVPHRDLSQFRAALPGEASVIAEESLLGDWTIPRIAECLPKAVAYRVGWYLQQLLKLEALRRLPASSEALIWDGDTVPLRPMNFKDAGGRIGFYVGHERYGPYFATTRRLLGLGRAVPYSFVAQCMYLRVHWVHELLACIEERAAAGWIETILAAVTGSYESEFSEYETIGTYVATQYPRDFYINPRRWFRWGMAHFGAADHVTAAGLGRLARTYDYVALESWDQGRAAWFRSRKERFIDRVGLARVRHLPN